MFPAVIHAAPSIEHIFGKLYIGFVFSFFSTWFAAVPIMVAAYTVGLLIGGRLEQKWVGLSLLVIGTLVLLRYLFSYLQARLQGAISYELAARDRLAVGEALKRVSLGYFQQMDTGHILNSITTGLHTLKNMGIRMVDSFIGRYLNFLCLLALTGTLERFDIEFCHVDFGYDTRTVLKNVSFTIL